MIGSQMRHIQDLSRPATVFAARATQSMKRIVAGAGAWTFE